MGLQRMDADTSETLAGIVRPLRRAAELVWMAVDADGGGPPRQLLALSIDLAADEPRNLLPDAVAIDSPLPIGNKLVGSRCRPARCGSRNRAAPPPRLAVNSAGPSLVAA
jgi:hypothetical protein